MADIVQIDNRTWRIEDEGVRFFLLEGTKSALLVDTGMNCPNAREIAEGLTELPIELINTHADPDHISGNAAFDSAMMSAAEEGNYRSFGATGAIDAVADGDIIDLGDRKLQVIGLAGHTPGSIALLDIEGRVLISGDAIQDGNIFMFGPARNMEAYVASLEDIRKYDGRFDEIYPSHGSIPVQPSIIGELLEAAKQVLAGNVEGKQVEFFGNPVMLYKFDCAGFLCPMPAE